MRNASSPHPRHTRRRPKKSPVDSKPKTRRKRKKKPPPEVDPIFASLLNGRSISLPTREFRFHPVRRWRFDYSWPLHKVALEIEGGVFSRGRHVRPMGFLADMEKYNAAAVLGWRVLRCTPDTLYHKDTLDTIDFAIAYSSTIDRTANGRQEFYLQQPG